MEASGSWWAPQSSKLLKPSSSVWRVRFPSASATGRGHVSEDPRRNLPRTDTLLASDWVRAASTHLNATTTRAIVRRYLDRARTQPSFTSATFRDDLVADLTPVLLAHSGLVYVDDEELEEFDEEGDED